MSSATAPLSAMGSSAPPDEPWSEKYRPGLAATQQLRLKKKQYFEDPDPNPKRTNKFEKLGWNADETKFYYRGEKGVFWLDPTNYLDKDDPASAISAARGNKHTKAKKMDDAALGTLHFIADSGGALATPAHTSASVEPSSVSSVDSEAAVIANAQARANPADRALRAEVRTAQRLFAPGGDGAVAAAMSYAVAQVALVSHNGSAPDGGGEDDESAPYALLPLFDEAPKLDHRSAASVLKLQKANPPEGLVDLIRKVRKLVPQESPMKEQRRTPSPSYLPRVEVDLSAPPTGSIRYKRRLSPASASRFLAENERRTKLVITASPAV